jgi:hypothetical protein
MGNPRTTEDRPDCLSLADKGFIDPTPSSCTCRPTRCLVAGAERALYDAPGAKYAPRRALLLRVLVGTRSTTRP